MWSAGVQNAPKPPPPGDHALGIHHGRWSDSDAQPSWEKNSNEHRRILVVINTSLIVIKYSSKIDLLLLEL